MQLWNVIFRVIISIVGLTVIAFDVLLYNFCEKQKIELNTMSDQQKVESQVDSNKFKYQQDQIEHLSKDLDDVRQQIKDQKDALADQKDESSNIQTSLVDIKAESDAIKQDIKGWQKDYVSVLAALEKKMDDSQNAIKSVKDDLDSFEKNSHPLDNSVSSVPPEPSQVGSQ